MKTHSTNEHALEPNRATVESWLKVLSKFALDDVDALPNANAAGRVATEGLRIATKVSTSIPELPLTGGVEEIRDLLEQSVEAALLTPGPGYLAYVPGGGLLAAGLADLVANWTNRYTGLSAAAPALCRLEADVLKWLAGEFGYDDKAHGVLTSGGSLANLSAIVTARFDRLGEDADLRKAVAYTSSQAHHSVGKSFRLAGIPARMLRSVPVDDRLRIDPRALAEHIATDRRAGLQPFLVVSAAGTTNTGAIDPLGSISELCDANDLWHHVDAAYGGAFVLCPKGRHALQGISAAHSITFDPHKGMFLPYGTGCLLVRDGEALRRAHMTEADYLQDFDAHDRSAEAPSPCDYGPELSRDYRGLRLWLPLMLHGAAAFRHAVAEKLELAEEFYASLKGEIQAGLPLEIVDEPQLSTIPFRLTRHEGELLADWNARNEELQVRINRQGRAFLSSTNLPVEDGHAFTLRVCILSFRTHREHMAMCLDDLRASVGR